MKRGFIAAIMLVMVFTSLANLFAAGQKDVTAQSGGKAYRYTMVIYGTAGNPFWKKVVAGAQETAATLGVSVDIQYADDNPERQNNIIETAIANRVNGIGLIINIDEAYTANIRRARAAGIPVIAYNIDDTRGPAGSERMAFIGQDFVTAGYLITKELIKEYKIGRGDLVLCPVEHPDAVYAAKRFEGVKKALDEVGARGDVLGTGSVSLEDTLGKMSQYLIGHRNTKAILAMGGMPLEVAPQAAEEAGMKGLPNAGFDITKTIIRNILDGKTLATVDQQPYYQGAFTITQLYLNNKYGLIPCDINTGGAIITKHNAQVVMDLADTVR
jgi:ABC-type sugar transport system substrate-binding protein